MIKKEPLKPTKLFKDLILERINSIRPSIVLDKNTQHKGYRFKSNDFIFEKIVDSIGDFTKQIDRAFSVDEPIKFSPDAVLIGEYDHLIIDVLNLCGIADHQAENSMRLN